MIPFWIFAILGIGTFYLWVITCRDEAPVKKGYDKFKCWCRDLFYVRR